MKKRKTAGELSLKASQDNSIYDPMELAYAITDDVIKQVQVCGLRHEKIFDEPEYFVAYITAGDPMLKNVIRKKFAAFLHMPRPTPQQSVFLYNKINHNIKRLWSLPNATTMATISEAPLVAKHWFETKKWCDAFYHGWVRQKDGTILNTTPSHFFNVIRKMHGIHHLSEGEYLKLNREKLIKAGCKETDSRVSEPFDFSKVSVNQVVDSNQVLAKKDLLDNGRQTQSLNGHVGPKEGQNISIMS